VPSARTNGPCIGLPHAEHVLMKKKRKSQTRSRVEELNYVETRLVDVDEMDVGALGVLD
jgi:hypothetical protein